MAPHARRTLAAVLGLLVAASAVVASAVGSAPHIVFIVADDLGWNDVSFHGSEVKTPVLDSLVKGGVHLDNYYGHSICTPSRSAIMSGRFASHNGLQHSFIDYGQRLGLPLQFKTLPQHMDDQGYSAHMVGKWHLGQYSWDYAPTRRGFESFFGYLGGGEDYYTHSSGGYLDLFENETPVFSYNGTYSTSLFVTKAIDVIQNYSVSHTTAALRASEPLFLYLAFQAVHDPLQAPEECTAQYAHLANRQRATLAGIATCMDSGVGKVVAALNATGLWGNTLLVFVSDNGGPPYVANSNWPMRGGKWTMWEGGHHLVGFVHHGGGLLPIKNYTGLAHHADWAATLVEAAGGTLRPDSASPPMDSISFWRALLDPSPSAVGARNVTLLNADITNQIHLNDADGWSGYAGLVVQSPSLGFFKIALGDQGVPNDWCAPNEDAHIEMGPTDSYPLDDPPTQLHSSPTQCTTRPNMELLGDSEGKVSNISSDSCCHACLKAAKCGGWNWNADSGSSATGTCVLQTSINQKPPRLCENCTCGSGSASLPVPWTAVMPNPNALSCKYSGSVPFNRTGILLFDLSQDLREASDISASRPDVVQALLPLLEQFIASAVPPLNENPASRTVDPAAIAAAKAAKAWVPWVSGS